MTVIEHIVLSGGGPVGLLECGALKYLSINKFIEYKNIKSIYCTSVGGIIGFIYILNFDWSWIDDFFIKRPWSNLMNLNSNNYINIFYNKGLLDKSIIVNSLKSLFLAKDISLEITLKEFYKLTNIELNLYTSNLNKFKKEKLNYINNPELKLIDAIYMSLTVPILFIPLYINNAFYLDGGIFINCPVNECLMEKKCHIDSVLCFMNDKRNPIDLSNNFYIENNYGLDENKSNLNNDSNFFEFIIHIIKTLFNNISVIENENTIIIKNIINIALTCQTVDIKYWNFVFNNESERKYLITLAEIQADLLLKKLNFHKKEKEILDSSCNIYDISSNIFDISSNYHDTSSNTFDSSCNINYSIN